MKYYAIGAPIGRISEGTAYSFFREGQLFQLPAAAFEVWARFLRGAELAEVTADADFVSRIGLKQISQLTQALIDADMLVEASALLTHVPQRQGQGLGLDPQKGHCTIMLGKEIPVQYPTYLFWAHCDGQANCQAILQRMPAPAAALLPGEAVLFALDELLQRDLIQFVG